MRVLNKEKLIFPLLMIIKWDDKNQICCINDKGNKGTYVICFVVKVDLALQIGNFRKGKIINFEEGYYIYIGSALADRGSTSLGNRLLRHCTKTNGENWIKKDLLIFFDQIGIDYTKNMSPKKLFWNIDYILDNQNTEVIGILFIRSSKRFENLWSKFLENLDETIIFETGLGANDSQNLTNIQRLNIDNPDIFIKWWNALPMKLLNISDNE